MLGVGISEAPGSAAEETTTEIWDEHRTAFAIFRACRTQWRVAALAHAVLYLGLDYPGVEVVMRRLLPRSSDRATIFADLQIMEAEALSVLNESDA